MCCDSIYAVRSRCESLGTDWAHLAVKTLLVDDAVIFGRLARSTQTCTVVLHDSAVKLGNDELGSLITTAGGSTCLRHDDNFLARKLELLDRVAQDDLGETV